MEDKKEEPNTTSKKITSPKKTTKNSTAIKTKKKEVKSHDEAELQNITPIENIPPRTQAFPHKSKGGRPPRPSKLTPKLIKEIEKKAVFAVSNSHLAVLVGIHKRILLIWYNLGRSIHDTLEVYYTHDDPLFTYEGRTYDEFISQEWTITAKRCLQLYEAICRAFGHSISFSLKSIMESKAWQAHAWLLIHRSPEHFVKEKELQSKSYIDTVLGEENNNKKKKELTIEQKRAIAEIAGVKFDE